MTQPGAGLTDQPLGLLDGVPDHVRCRNHQRRRQVIDLVDVEHRERAQQRHHAPAGVGALTRAHPQGYRTAPSAGALQPLIVYLVAGHVTGLSAGVYQYDPKAHALILTRPGDLRAALAATALRQRSVRDAPAVLVVAADPRRTAEEHGPRAQSYVHIEVGHAAQNVYLQATARGLAAVLMGSFEDPKTRDVLGLPADHSPLALMPFGRGR